jgi:hypothetical protein
MYTQAVYLKMVTTPFPAKDFTENTERCYKIYPVLLPLCIIAVPGKVICKYRSSYDLNPHFQFFFLLCQ